MEYRNPTIPEGINTSRTHPLREFAVLTLGALALVALLAVTLGHLGGQISRWLVSVETELAWGQSIRESLSGDATSPPLQHYLDGLKTRIEAAMPQSAELPVTLLYSSEDTVNAFATLGGTVVLYRGLLEKLPHENALLMLIAHEIAHVRHRDPIVGIGNALGIQSAVALLFTDIDASPLNNAGLYTQLAFTRDMEQDADLAALQALMSIQGHVSGAADLFHALQEERRGRGTGEQPAFFSTHPLDEQRIASIARVAREQGWADDRTTTPLPAGFKNWLAAD